jgi:hypothetical protein
MAWSPSVRRAEQEQPPRGKCGATIYHVVSPDHAATGSDVNNTRQLVGVIGNVPQGLTMFCLTTRVDNGDTFQAFFLITPAG